MADPRGFLEIERRLPERRAVSERLDDWQEVYSDFPEEELEMGIIGDKGTLSSPGDYGTDFYRYSRGSLALIQLGVDPYSNQAIDRMR